MYVCGLASSTFLPATIPCPTNAIESLRPDLNSVAFRQPVDHQEA